MVALTQALRRQGASEALQAAEAERQAEIERQKLEDEIRLRQAKTAALRKELQQAVAKQRAAEERIKQWKKERGFL